MKTKLLERFGMFKKRHITTIDNHNLFVKGGVSVIAALAGEGKTTYLHTLSEGWKKDYQIIHFNFDNAPAYDKDMINCPVSEEDFEDFWNLMETSLDENDIVIIDSLKAMTSYLNLDIESNRDMYSIMMKFRFITSKTKATIILVHHVYKPKHLKTDISSFYGSRAIEEQCDSGFMYKQNEITVVKSRTGYQRDTKISI